MKLCFFCAEEIQDDAIKCKHCGEFLDKKPQGKWYFRTQALVITFLCAGPLVLPLVWLTPNLSRAKRIMITIVVFVITYLLWEIAQRSLQSISQYYDYLK